jgi:hypothetical protein
VDFGSFGHGGRTAGAALNGPATSAVRSVKPNASTWTEAFAPAPLARRSAQRARRWPPSILQSFSRFELIGSTKIAPRVREITDGRDNVEFNWLLNQIFALPARVERGFRYRPRSTIWERS